MIINALRKTISATAASLVLAFTGSAQAAQILYWADFVAGTDAMAAALATSGHTVTTSTNQADFVSDVAAGGWDLVIFMNQATSNASAQTAIQGWVTGGGRAILADWTRNAATGAVFDATYTGGVNQTLLNVTDPALAAGIVTNPITLTNPGWGVFSMSMDDVPLGAASAALFGNGTDAILFGNGGLTIVNGFLNDTFGAAASPRFMDGVTLYLNEIDAVLGVPEPATIALLGLGLAGLAATRRRKQ